MRVYMAGAENLTHSKILKQFGTKNVLLSFFYLRGKKHEEIVRILSFVREFAESIFLDSGAHTLIVAFYKKKGAFRNNYSDKIDLQEYIKDFFDFITKYSNYFDSIAELDIGIVPGIGYEKVKEWREYMKSLGLINKMVVVMHYQHFQILLGQRKEEWRAMLREYPKLALGDGPDGLILKEIFDIRKEEGHNNKIHGFAETKLSKMQWCPYYSVDSTSWLQGVRYNHFPIFKNGKFRTISAQEYREKYGIDLAKMSMDKKLGLSLKAYQDAEKRATQLQKARGIKWED